MALAYLPSPPTGVVHLALRTSPFAVTHGANY
jgi:hypothetical protein